jgi:hypothetical protein
MEVAGITTTVLNPILLVTKGIFKGITKFGWDLGMPC